MGDACSLPCFCDGTFPKCEHIGNQRGLGKLSVITKYGELRSVSELRLQMAGLAEQRSKPTRSSIRLSFVSQKASRAAREAAPLSRLTPGMHSFRVRSGFYLKSKPGKPTSEGTSCVRFSHVCRLKYDHLKGFLSLQSLGSRGRIFCRPSGDWSRILFASLSNRFRKHGTPFNVRM